MSLFSQLAQTYIPHIRVQDLFEILLLVFIIYRLIVQLKGTRAFVVLKGVLILLIFYNLVYLLEFEAILVLLQSVTTILIFALIIVFQPEMRKILEQLGTQSLTNKFGIISYFKKSKEPHKYYSDKDISELTKACFAMGEVKTGALIVIQREIPLADIIETGITLNADLSSPLLINTFEKNTPLHDGAVVEIGSKLVSATCYLPLSQNPNINKNLGTRHRAAIGISEVTDCVVLVVSEETGGVSIVYDGVIQGKLSKDKFSELLFKYQKREESKEGAENKKSNEKKAFKSILKEYNLPTWFISLLIGFFAWVLLINIANPITSVEFEDVPIEFINTSIIEATGNTYELVSDGMVSVRVRDKRTIVDALTVKDIRVVADFSKLSYVNAVPLEASIIGNNTAEIIFISDNTVVVELDSIINKEFIPTLDVYYSSDSKYYIPNLELSDNTIVLTGGKAKIDLIDKVVFSFDTTSNTENYTSTAIPIVYDRNGTVLDNSDFTFSVDSIKATGYGFPIKSVPLEINVDKDILAGYKIYNIEYEPKMIRIASDADYLKSFESISVNVDLNLNADSLSNNQYVKSVSVLESIPEGIYLADMNEFVNVTFEFEQLVYKEISFTDANIRLRGDLVEENPTTIEFLDKDFVIVVSGEDALLKNLNKDSITPYIDVSGLSVGTYNLIVQFDGLDNVVLTSNVSARLKISTAK